MYCDVFHLPWAYAGRALGTRWAHAITRVEMFLRAFGLGNVAESCTVYAASSVDMQVLGGKASIRQFICKVRGCLGVRRSYPNINQLRANIGIVLHCTVRTVRSLHGIVSPIREKRGTSTVPDCTALSVLYL